MDIPGVVVVILLFTSTKYSPNLTFFPNRIRFLSLVIGEICLVCRSWTTKWDVNNWWSLRWTYLPIGLLFARVSSADNLPYSRFIGLNPICGAELLVRLRDSFIYFNLNKAHWWCDLVDSRRPGSSTLENGAKIDQNFIWLGMKIIWRLCRNPIKLKLFLLRSFVYQQHPAPYLIRYAKMYTFQLQMFRLRVCMYVCIHVYIRES